MSIKSQGGIFGRNPTFNDVTVEGDLSIGDNVKTQFGAGNDLQIYSNGTHGFIDEAGPGGLYIRTSSLNLGKYTGENYITAYQDGDVRLYYDNVEKLRTTSTGISVTGNVTVPSGNGIDFSATSGTGTSELFDDYEEGTWTPDLKNGTSITYNSRSGTYIKIGNMVFLTANIDVSNNDTSDGSGIDIGDLPYAPSASKAAQFTFGLRRGFLGAKGNLNVGAWTHVNGLFLIESDNNYITYSECNSSGILQFSASYEV